MNRYDNDYPPATRKFYKALKEIVGQEKNEAWYSAYQKFKKHQKNKPKGYNSTIITSHPFFAQGRVLKILTPYEEELIKLENEYHELRRMHTVYIRGLVRGEKENNKHYQKRDNGLSL